jgi:hypothetical protein
LRPGAVVVWSNEVAARDSVRVGNSIEQVVGVAQGAMPLVRMRMRSRRRGAAGNRGHDGGAVDEEVIMELVELLDEAALVQQIMGMATGGRRHRRSLGAMCCCINK